mgnify:CR=1 FL=1
MDDLNNKLNESQFITEGWLEDIYDEIEKEDHIICMDGSLQNYHKGISFKRK